MINIKAALFTIVFVIVWGFAAVKANASELNTLVEVTTDSDSGDTTLFTGGYATNLNGWKYGVNAGVFTASDPANTISLNKVQGTFKRLTKGVQIRGRVDHYFNSNWTTTGGQISVASKLGKNVYSTVSAEKNIVDSINAIDSKITFTSIGISGNYNTSFYDTTLVGAYSTQNFSDGNVKDITKFKVIVPIAYGFSAQGVLKIKDASFNPKQYFSPKHLQDELVGLGYRKRYKNKWYVDSKLLFGTQQLGTAAKSPETAFRILVRGNVSKDTQLTFVYDLLDIGGVYPYKWKMYSIRMKYSF